MDYEKIAAVNGATTAYAAAVQAYIAAQEFYIEMCQTEPGSLPGGSEDLGFAESTANSSRIHLESAALRLEFCIDHLAGLR